MRFAAARRGVFRAHEVKSLTCRPRENVVEPLGLSFGSAQILGKATDTARVQIEEYLFRVRIESGFKDVTRVPTINLCPGPVGEAYNDVRLLDQRCKIDACVIRIGDQFPPVGLPPLPPSLGTTLIKRSL